MWHGLREQQDDTSDGGEKNNRRKGWRKREDNPSSSTSSKEATAPKMSRDKLPLIGSSGHKATVLSSLQRPSPHLKRKRGALHSHPSTAPPDSMAPWEGPSLSDSSFTCIPRPPPPPPPPPPPRPLPPAPPPSAAPPTSHASQPIMMQSVRSGRLRRRPLPPRRPPRPPRLPPLRPVSNLSFTRSFTFSFFELPLHQSARCRAERLKDLTLLLRQIHY